MGHLYQNGEFGKVVSKLSPGTKELQKRQNRGAFMTGYMFLSGDAGQEEAVKGYAWTEISMINGYEGAKEVIDYAELSMKESQIKMAKALAKQCLVSKLKNCP